MAKSMKKRSVRNTDSALKGLDKFTNKPCLITLIGDEKGFRPCIVREVNTTGVFYQVYNYRYTTCGVITDVYNPYPIRFSPWLQVSSISLDSRASAISAFVKERGFKV